MKNILISSLIIVLVLSIGGGLVFYQASALQGRLLAGGPWASEEDIKAGLSWAKYGVRSPLVAWANTNPEVAFLPDAELVLIARDIDYSPLSVQLRRPDSGVTQPTLAYYIQRKRVYAPLHPNYRLSEVVAEDGRFLITVELRSSATQGIEGRTSFVATLTPREAIDLVEGPSAPGKTALAIQAQRIEYLQRRSEK